MICIHIYIYIYSSFSALIYISLFNVAKTLLQENFAESLFAQLNLNSLLHIVKMSFSLIFFLQNNS